MRPREQIVHETLREFKRTQQRNQPQARQLSDKIEFVRITEQVCYENRTICTHRDADALAQNHVRTKRQISIVNQVFEPSR